MNSPATEQDRPTMSPFAAQLFNDAAEAARKAAAAPDAKKLLFLVSSVRSLLGVNPKMATEAGQQAFKDARFYLEDAAEKIEHLAAKL